LGVDTEEAVPTEPLKTETLTEETKEITEKKPESKPVPKTKQ